MALTGRQLQALRQLIQQREAIDDGLLSFRAGRMTMDDNKIVTAKNDRGKIKFSKSDDGILHLEWINRISKKQVLDIMIFPDSGKWVRVEECKDGRVYVLKFIGSLRREFFWMQEPSEEKDKEISEKINKLISGTSGDGANQGNAVAAAQQAQIAQSLGLGNFGAGGANGLGGLGAFGGLGGFGGLGQLGGFAPQGQRGNNTGGSGSGSGSSGTGGNTNANSNANGNGNDLTQMILNALQSGGGTGANGASGGNPLMQAMIQQQLQQREELKKEPDMSDILDPSQDEIKQILDDEKVVERLGEHLPQEMRDRESILEQLSSPQFLGSLARLNHIINSPQMTLLLQQMGIQPGDKVGVRAFIEAVLKQANQDGNNNNSNNSNNNSGSDNNNGNSGNTGNTGT